MNVNAVHASERDLQMIIDTIAELTCQPAQASSASASTTRVADGVTVEAPANGSLRNASINRLACLFRHWTWADEAIAQLLCGFSEAALEHALLSELQLETLRPDLEASLPGLRACRQLLVVIPASLEDHPRIVDLLHDSQALDRLRRIHHAFGEALREEQLSRELDLLLYEH